MGIQKLQLTNFHKQLPSILGGSVLLNENADQMFKSGKGMVTAELVFFNCLEH